MGRHIVPAFRIMVLMTILTGFVYPGVITGLCQLFFPRQASGSMIRAGGQILGSSLIGQNFTQPEYFHPRPSATGNDGYDPMASGGSNLGPTSRVFYRRLQAAVTEFHRENLAYRGPIPADIVTASASGLDPDISPASALAQAPRIARIRGASLQRVRRLIHEYTRHRTFGFLGEPRVNVLELNLALDRDFPRPSASAPKALRSP